ncbi:hypothetical protein KAI92_02880 [Candidatus Parcubacteria bacterium]|nr:hypothetical protein [Candidatus Parcubacteria bacterium]
MIEKINTRIVQPINSPEKELNEEDKEKREEDRRRNAMKLMKKMKTKKESGNIIDIEV